MNECFIAATRSSGLRARPSHSYLPTNLNVNFFSAQGQKWTRSERPKVDRRDKSEGARPAAGDSSHAGPQPSAPPARRSAAAANAAPRQHQHLRAQRRQHGQLERPAQLAIAAILSRISAASAQNRTKTKQHRVSCSMVDKMDVLDSAQRITSPRSQHTASSTGDSLQLSMRSAMCAVCPTFSTSARSRSPRVGRM